MAPLLSIRIFFRFASAVGIVALSFLLGSLAPLWSAATSTPVASATAPFSVNHFRKGDRLPLFDPHDRERAQRSLEQLETAPKMPIGCDPAFSPVASPSERPVYGRCMV